MKKRMNDRFVDRLPIALSKAQRMRIEAIILAVDTIDCDINDIDRFRKGQQTRDDEEQLSSADRAWLFRATWSIVDRMHTISRMLAGQTDIKLKRDHPFYSLAEVASRMRNRMDHLSDNLNNLKTKRASGPILGALTYTRVKQEAIRIVDGKVNFLAHQLVLIAASPINHDWRVNISELVQDIYYPVSPPIFWAFGDRLDLYQVKSSVDNIRNLLNDQGAAAWNEQRHSIADDASIDADDLLNAAAPSGVLVVTQTFDAPMVVDDLMA